MPRVYRSRWRSRRQLVVDGLARVSCSYPSRCARCLLAAPWLSWRTPAPPSCCSRAVRRGGQSELAVHTCLELKGRIRASSFSPALCWQLSRQFRLLAHWRSAHPTGQVPRPPPVPVLCRWILTPLARWVTYCARRHVLGRHTLNWTGWVMARGSTWSVDNRKSSVALDTTRNTPGSIRRSAHACTSVTSRRCTSSASTPLKVGSSRNSTRSHSTVLRATHTIEARVLKADALLVVLDERVHGGPLDRWVADNSYRRGPAVIYSPPVNPGISRSGAPCLVVRPVSFDAYAYPLTPALSPRGEREASVASG